MKHAQNRRPFRRRPPIGSAPGTLAPPDDSTPTSVRLVGYSADAIEQTTIVDSDALAAFRARWPVVWVDVCGFRSMHIIKALGERLGVHPLLLEDAVHLHQRPKVEPDGERLFLIVRTAPGSAPRIDEGATSIATDQVAVYLQPGCLLTIREHQSALFDPVHTRLQVDGAFIRRHGADYLAYAVTDTVVDGFFPVIDDLTDQVHVLEDDVLDPRTHSSGVSIHRARQLVSSLRRTIWPYRETLFALQRDRHGAITEETRVFLRDTLDHSVQLLEAVDHLRDTMTGLMEVHLSLESQRMNEVMKVLTIISTLFMPLGFLAGVYGMNFTNMPELHTTWGYPALLAVMATIAIGMLLWFWRRGWIRASDP